MGDIFGKRKPLPQTRLGDEVKDGYLCCSYCKYQWPVDGMYALDKYVARCRRCDLADPHKPKGTFAAGDWVVLHEKLPAVRIFDPKLNEAGLLAVMWIREDESVHIGYCPPKFIRLAAGYEPRRP